jgi:hypothetical protein
LFLSLSWERYLPANFPELSYNVVLGNMKKDNDLKSFEQEPWELGRRLSQCRAQ